MNTKKHLNPFDLNEYRSTDWETIQQDVQILEKDVRREPHNGHALFRLALVCAASGQEFLALERFKKRVQMGGDKREVFYSLYRIAILQERLEMDPELFIQSYLNAYHFLPSQAEPLFDLANYFIKNENYILGYVLSEYALGLPLPEEPCFKQTTIYEYGLLYQFAQCAFHIGRHHEAQETIKKIIAVPSLPKDLRTMLEKNLTLSLFETFA